jgi:hypothetical protein
MSMSMMVLSLVHIAFGAFWVGAVLLLAGFIGPAVEAAGPAGGTFMQKLNMETRFPMAMSVAGGLTMLSGIILYWIVSNHLSVDWLGSNHGLLITIGSVAGLGAGVAGLTLSKRASLGLARLISEIQAAGAPPSAEQQARMQKLKAALRRGSTLTALLLLIAVACMGLAHAV